MLRGELHRVEHAQDFVEVAPGGTRELVAAQEHLQAAGRLLGYVNRLLAVRRDSPNSDEHAIMDRVTAAVHAGLGADAAAALAVEGRGLDDEAAAALAVRESDGG